MTLALAHNRDTVPLTKVDLPESTACISFKIIENGKGPSIVP